MELKDRLAYLMKRREIANAAELSRQTGLTQVAIRNYLRGIKVPNSQALVKLSRALSTTTDYLLTGSPSRPDRIPLLSKIPKETLSPGLMVNIRPGLAKNSLTAARLQIPMLLRSS